MSEPGPADVQENWEAGTAPTSIILSFLPYYVRRILDTCPTAGAGVHRWLYLAALALVRSGVDPKMAALLIREATADCGRYVDSREIQEAVRNAYRAVDLDGDVSILSVPRPAAWPAVNDEQVEAISLNGPGLRGLELLSPVRFNNSERHTENIIDALFPGNPLLCCGGDKNKFTTRSREEWRGRMSAMPFVVPSPMSAREGLTTGGKKSARSLSNTGPRHYLVIEFDKGSADVHASVLWHLATLAPLALVVFSAGKSIHGWLSCQGQPEEQVRKFMRYAVSLGADPATFTRCQMVRMPDGTRADGNGARQSVHYFNGEVVHAR